MSRTSSNQYMLPDGRLTTDENETGATLWNGYDYDKQYWVFEGKKDERSLEELQAVNARVEAKGRLFKAIYGACIEPADELTDEDVVKVALAAVHQFGEKYGVRFEYLLK